MKFAHMLAIAASLVFAHTAIAEAKPSKAAVSAKSPNAAPKPIVGDLLEGTNIRRNGPKPIIGDILQGTDIRRNGVVIPYEDMTPMERLRLKLKRLFKR